MEPCPFDKTNRSRFGHAGFFGLYLRNLVHSVYAMGAIPIGMPGCPEFAFSTASTAKKRMVLIAFSVKEGFFTSGFLTMDFLRVFIDGILAQRPHRLSTESS